MIISTPYLGDTTIPIIMRRVHFGYSIEFYFNEDNNDHRKGKWEEAARDRDRFKRRIQSLADIIDPILRTQHRNRIYNNLIKKLNVKMELKRKN